MSSSLIRNFLTSLYVVTTLGIYQGGPRTNKINDFFIFKCLFYQPIKIVHKVVTRSCSIHTNAWQILRTEHSGG